MPLCFGRYLLPVPPVAPLEPPALPLELPDPLGADEPLEAEPLLEGWRWGAVPLALPEPLTPLPAPDRAPLSLLLPLLALRP